MPTVVYMAPYDGIDNFPPVKQVIHVNGLINDEKDISEIKQELAELKKTVEKLDMTLTLVLRLITGS